MLVLISKRAHNTQYVESVSYFAWALTSGAMGGVVIYLWVVNPIDEMYTHGSARYLYDKFWVYLALTAMGFWLIWLLSPFDATATSFAVGAGLGFIHCFDKGFLEPEHATRLFAASAVFLALAVLLSPFDVTMTTFAAGTGVAYLCFENGVRQPGHALRCFTASGVCLGLTVLLSPFDVTGAAFTVGTVMASIRCFMDGFGDPDHAQRHFTASVVCLVLTALLSPEGLLPPSDKTAAALVVHAGVQSIRCFMGGIDVLDHAPRRFAESVFFLVLVVFLSPSNTTVTALFTVIPDA